MDAETLTSTALSRRSALKTGAITAFLLSQATLFEQLVLAPARPASAATAFSDIQFEFVLTDGRVAGLKQIDPSGEYMFVRK